ncbi:MAG: hypothetical protein HY897_13260, partial [Deltaproteobacteria bacterium]|nr:hypothetical protein [Deltaproteobacteria bacterium]
VAVIGKAAAGPNPPTKVLLFADSIGNRVRAVNIGDFEAEVFGEKLPPGYITTVAGKKCLLPGWLQLFCGGSAGDGGPAKQAHLKRPTSVSYDEDRGRLTIVDEGNERLRVVSADGRITTVGGGGGAEAGMARETYARKPGAHALALVRGTDGGTNFSRKDVAWVRDDYEIMTNTKGLWLAERVGDNTTSGVVGQELKFDMFTPIGGVSGTCFKTICGHAAEQNLTANAGNCGLRHAPDACKRRVSDYYSSSTGYNLTRTRQDVPIGLPGPGFVSVSTFGYTRNSPGKDKWRIVSHIELLPGHIQKEVWTEVYTEAKAGWDDSHLKGVDLGASPFDLNPDQDKIDEPDDRIPDGKCAGMQQKDFIHCLHKITGSRASPVRPDGTIVTDGTFPAGAKYLDVDGTAPIREYLFSGTTTTNGVTKDTGFEGFTKRVKSIGADTIGLQLRLGVAEVFVGTDTSGRKCADCTDFVYFHNPCETQTPDVIERYIDLAWGQGIEKFTLEFVAASVDTFNISSVDANPLYPETLRQQYLVDWFAGSRTQLSAAHVVNCYKGGLASKKLSEANTVEGALTAERLLHGEISVYLPEVTNTGSGSTLAFPTYPDNPVRIGKDECDDQAKHQVFNYVCLVKFWAAQAKVWIEKYASKDNDGDGQPDPIQITISLANDYYAIAKFLASNPASLAAIKGACDVEGCKWTIAPAYNGLMPANPSELAFLEGLDFVGANLSLHGACVEDLNRPPPPAQQCSGFSTKTDPKDLFAAFGEKAEDVQAGKCAFFHNWKESAPCNSSGGFTAQTEIRTCYCHGNASYCDTLVQTCNNGQWVNCQTTQACGSGASAGPMCLPVGGDYPDYCYQPGRSPDAMLDPPFEHLHTNISSSFFNQWAIDPTRLLNQMAKADIVFMGASDHFYELGSYNPSAMVSVKTTRLDHQEQADYYEALMASVYERYPHKLWQDPVSPWDFAEFLESHSDVRLMGLKSNFDELTYHPMRGFDPMWWASSRSHWQKPLAGYLSIVFSK